MRKSTAFIISFVILDSLGDCLFELPERFFSDFLLLKEIGDDFFYDFVDILISFSEIFVELIDYHLSELFSLLYGLCFLYGGMEFSTFARS